VSEGFGTDFDPAKMRMRHPGWKFTREGDLLVAVKGDVRLEADNARDLDVKVYRNPFEQDAAEDSARDEGGHWPSAG
jgi:hypothetical protein